MVANSDFNCGCIRLFFSFRNHGYVRLLLIFKGKVYDTWQYFPTPFGYRLIYHSLYDSAGYVKAIVAREVAA